MRRTAIAGVGYTELTRNSGRSVLDQATEAALAACADAGLPPEQVDGIGSHIWAGDSECGEAIATAMALPQLRYLFDFNMGGQAPSYLVGNAAMAIATGHAENVIIFRALNGRSGARVGTAAPPTGGAAQYRYPIGYAAYLMYIAMWARRFLMETGQTSEDLAAVAMTQRKYAELNPRAVLRKPLTREDYFASRWIAEPFRLPDCTTEVDGACAVLVTSLDRARDLRHPPAVIASSMYRAGARPGLDNGNHVLWEDYTRNFTSWLRDELFERAGLGPADVDFAEIYDCFTSTVLMGLEGLGLCERGGSGELVRSGATGIGGRLPVNTHGGLLSEGYVHGMNSVAEAVLQIQGRGGARQAAKHEVGVVTSGALVNGSALVLTADR
jgi:acetyl-CoA acetyltransferase